jgi:hypothetical protein
MHTCAHDREWALFTWELRQKAKGRRWFYARLEKLLGELQPKNWHKLGGSVYLVKEKHSGPFVELLKCLEGPDLKWFRFKVKDRLNTAHVCTT